MCDVYRVLKIMFCIFDILELRIDISRVLSIESLNIFRKYLTA
jgi:hypothetical protein